MDLDIDTGTMGIFSVGEESDIPDRYLKGPGYIISIRDNLVKSISIFFTGIMESDEVDLRVANKTHKYVSDTPRIIFQDKLIKNGKSVEINSATFPEDISKIFETPCDFWDDGSGIGMTFVSRGMEIEFSWRWTSGDRKQLDYMFIESVSSKHS